MTRFGTHLPAALVLLLALPGAAHAGSLAVAPLLGKNTDPMVVTNVTSLMSSEIDFMGEFDRVIDIDRTPPSLNSGCLSSTSCLGGIARSAGAGGLVTGTIASVGKSFTLDLVYFDGGRIVRRKEFTISSSPEAVADGMNAIVKELVTGVAPARQEKQEEKLTSFDFAAQDDFEFEELPDDALSDYDPEEDRRAEEEAARRRAEEEAARRRAEEERRRAEEEASRRRAEEERRRQEAEARRRAEEEAARRAEEERRQAQVEEVPEEFDPSMFSFGAVSADEMVADEPEDEDEGLSYLDLDEDEPRASSRVVDLDDDRGSSRTREARVATPKPQRQKVARVKKEIPDDFGTGVTLAMRAGYTNFQQFNFVSAGVELGVPVGDSGVQVLAGIDTYSVERDIPPAYRDPNTGQATEWNTIYPLNIGVAYRGGKGRIHPYIGADLALAPYYFDQDNKASWSVGPRARGGVDFMLADQFGLNLNAAVGYWQGKNWVVIQKDMKPGGVLPQLSLGCVLAF